jgi:hypothetical protein
MASKLTRHLTLAGLARFALAPRSAADRLARSCWAQCGNRARRDRLWLHRLPRPLSRRQARCVFFFLEEERGPIFDADTTAKAGTQVVIPYRDEDEKRHLKVTGDLGQIVSLVRSIRPSSVYYFVFNTAALGRNGTSVTRNRLPSVSGTPMSCTTSLDATMRPSMVHPVAFLVYVCGTDTLVATETSPLTTFM